jgi:CRP-like cAMP-binding protein
VPQLKILGAEADAWETASSCRSGSSRDSDDDSDEDSEDDDEDDGESRADDEEDEQDEDEGEQESEGEAEITKMLRQSKKWSFILPSRRGSGALDHRGKKSVLSSVSEAFVDAAETSHKRMSTALENIEGEVKSALAQPGKGRPSKTNLSYHRESAEISKVVLEKLNVVVQVQGEEGTEDGSPRSQIISAASTPPDLDLSACSSVANSPRGSRSNSPTTSRRGSSAFPRGGSLKLPSSPTGGSRRQSSSRRSFMRALTRRKSGLPERTCEVAVLRQGASFGEVALLNDSLRAATVRAKEDSFFATLSREDYGAVLKDAMEKQKKEKQSFLKSLHLLDELAEQCIDRLAALLQLRMMQRHEMVHDYGAPVLQVYFVREGEFSVDCLIRLGNLEEDHGSHGAAQNSSGAGLKSRHMSVIPAGNHLHAQGGGHGERHKRRTDRHGDRFITTALLVRPATIGLAGYMQNERRYKTRVVCQSVTGSVYSILAKELVSNLSRDQRTHLQYVAGARDLFYENRLAVLRHVLPRPKQKSADLFARGKRRWPQERTLFQRVHETNGQDTGRGDLYSVHGRLQIISASFQHPPALADAAAAGDASAAAPAAHKPGDADHGNATEEEHMKPLSLKPCWRMEALQQLGVDFNMPSPKAVSTPIADVPPGLFKGSQTLFHKGPPSPPQQSQELPGLAGLGGRKPGPGTSPTLQPQPSPMSVAGANQKARRNRTDSPAETRESPAAGMYLSEATKEADLDSEEGFVRIASLAPATPAPPQGITPKLAARAAARAARTVAFLSKSPKAAGTQGEGASPRDATSAPVSSSAAADAGASGASAAWLAATTGLFSDRLFQECDTLDGGCSWEAEATIAGATSSRGLRPLRVSTKLGSPSPPTGRTPRGLPPQAPVDLNCIYRPCVPTELAPLFVPPSSLGPPGVPASAACSKTVCRPRLLGVSMHVATL